MFDFSGNAKLEALLDSLDDLQIRLSLALDSPKTTADELHALHKEILQIEDAIAAQSRPE